MPFTQQTRHQRRGFPVHMATNETDSDSDSNSASDALVDAPFPGDYYNTKDGKKRQNKEQKAML
jgi:hypothetical protein